jgi:hypothetical protein
LIDIVHNDSHVIDASYVQHGGLSALSVDG